MRTLHKIYYTKSNSIIDFDFDNNRREKDFIYKLNMMAAFKKNIYALLIAIDTYPIASHCLSGCVNDLEAFKDYLTTQCESENCKLNLYILKNNEAKRESIIAGFDHFKKASNGDICVLYYCGHGSQMEAPREFWKTEKDRLLESIVCYDSRIEGGFDLVDKELGYLIWDTTHYKDIHFVVIMDCCHSGTNTRDPEVKCRMVETSRNIKEIRRFIGYENYGDIADVEIYQSTHIQIAAAKSDETAKELRIDGKTRGVFTYSLLEVLKQADSFISYAELLPRVAAKIYNKINDQHPQLDVLGNANKNALFLNGAVKPYEPGYLINYDERTKEWKFHAGALHGIIPSGIDSKTIIKIKNIDKEAIVKKVFSSWSYLDGLNDENISDQFTGIIYKMPIRKLKISFADAVPEENRVLITQKSWAKRYLFFEVTNDSNLADYLIHSISDERKNEYYLTKLGSSRPMFKRAEIMDSHSATIFLDNVEAVAKWVFVSELNNSQSTIRENEIEIELNKIEGKENVQDAIGESVDISKQVFFKYISENNKWIPPSFRLIVRKNSDRALFVKALYLGNDSSITEIKFPEEEFDNKHQRIEWGSTSILLENEKSYNAGIPEISEVIKIYISTEEFSVDILEQGGLEFDSIREVNTKREISKASIINKPDWKTFNIDISILRPLQSQLLTSEKPLKFQNTGISILAPKGFTTMVSFSALNTNTRSLVTKPSFLNNSYMLPFELLQGNNRSQGVSVIELNNVEGGNTVDVDNSIKIELGRSLSETEIVIPFGYDAETGLYYPLGVSGEQGIISITDIPDFEPTFERGLFDSLKIYFQKVVINKIWEGYKYPMLAQAQLDENLNMVYKNDPVEVKQAIADANNIILFVHGFIGDTTDQPKLLHRAKRKINGGDQPLNSLFDVALTFDYENLNTPIEQTAKDLKCRLKEYGIEECHDKNLILVAHSMGGLVSRWFLEKEGGDKYVTHFVQVGAPNNGSPWASVYDMTGILISNAMNFLPVSKVIETALSMIGRALGKSIVTIGQLQHDSEFLVKLNSEASPKIPYTIIAGNIHKIQYADDRQERLLRRVINRFRNKISYYKALDSLLFKQPNDSIVSVKSIHNVPDPKQITEDAGCDHFGYFDTPAGVKAIGDVLFNIMDELKSSNN